MKISLKKKMLAVFLVLAFLLVPMLTACNRGGEDNPPEVTTDEPPEEPLTHKVGFIYSGSIRNSTHNMIWEDARNQLEKNRGIDTCYIENVLISNYPEAVEVLLSNDVTIIVSTNHAFANETQTAALENTGIKFISFGGTPIANVTVFEPLLHQPANISGLAASYNSTAASFGIVTDIAMFNHEAVVNSYILGIKDFLERETTTHVNYVNSANEQDVRNAIDDLNRKGVDTVMLYLSTDYGIKYCEEKGIKVVAYSGTLPELAPSSYVTGFYFNVNSYLTEQVQLIQNDMFTPGRVYGEISSNHVKMINLNTTEGLLLSNTKEYTDLLYHSIVRNDNVFAGQIVDNFGKIQVEYGYTLSKAEILGIRWLELSVGNNIDDFSDYITELPIVPLIIREGWHEELYPWKPTETEAVTSAEEIESVAESSESSSEDSSESSLAETTVIVTGVQ
ncbi:MAG: BMP family ABC transporter substrate-binding protein [Oscillospiraceae bacterium]|nr:BMP family ABC transporter substrate-binding protein [Oscillospiraceae bacterium]